MGKIKEYIPFITLILIIITYILLSFKGCRINRMEDKIALLEGMNDSLTKVKNPDSSQTARITLLQGRNSELLLRVDSRDRTIRELQAEVKKNRDKIKNGGSVTIIEAVTDYSATVATTVSSVHPLNDSICDPTFESQAKDTTWIGWRSKSNKDSTSISIKVKNKYSVVIGSERDGLFKRKPIAMVTNYNPYTDTRSMRAFEVKDKRSKFTLSLQGGYGFTLKGLSPYVGIGVGFTVLSL